MYQILIAPLAAGIFAQILKPFIKTNNLKFNWPSLFSYSGMPSSHTAMAVSLASSLGLTQGAASPLFAVSIVLSFFIMRDAWGLRNYVGLNGRAVNYLVKDLNNSKIISEEKYPRLVEKVGHTPAQILGGAILGFLISLAAYYIY